MFELSSIIEEINQQIDGIAFARLFDYHPSKIQISDNTLKFFCPVHNERAFRSMVFDLEKHQFKCTMKRCPCFEGGMFVELWASFRKIEVIEAALELAEKLELDVDVRSIRKLAESLSDNAEQALAQNDLPSARGAIKQALAIDSHDLQLRLLSAQIFEAEGRREEALEERLMVYDGYLDRQEHEPARALLDLMLRNSSPNLALLERRVELARLEKSTPALIESLRQLGAYRQANNKPRKAIAAFEEAHQLDPRSLDLLETLAGLYEKAGDRKALNGTLGELAKRYEADEDVDRLLAVLNRQAALDPRDLKVREKIASAMILMGQSTNAREQWLTIANSRAEAGLFKEAGEIIARLLVDEPHDVELLEFQAKLLHKAGQKTEAIRAFRHLAHMAREVGLADRVTDYYEQARAVDPTDVGLRRDQAEWKLTNGDLDGGLNDLFGLADDCLAQGHQQEGMAILTEIATRAPNDLDKRLRIGRCLERNGMTNEAFASYCLLAGDLMKQDRQDAAQAICDEARRLRPMDPQVLELLIQSHLSSGNKAEAIEACRKFARQFEATGNLEAAEDALQRGIKIDRTESQAKMHLARLFEQTGRVNQAGALWLEMALFHRAQEQPERAVEAARETLRLEPDNREARGLLAEVLEAMGQINEAVEHWREMGLQMAGDEGDDPEALKLLTHALELSPRDGQLLSVVAAKTRRIEGPDAALPFYTRWLESLEARGHVDQLIEAYGEAVKDYPDQIGWRRRLAGMLTETGAKEEAAIHLEALLAADKEAGVATDEQHGTLEQLVELKPDRLDLRSDLARSLARQGQASEAVRIFEHLADHYLENEQPENALQMLQEALDLAPQRSDLLQRTGELLDKTGRLEEAVQFYEKLIELSRRCTDRTQSIPVLERLLAYTPERTDWVAELGDLYEAEGDIDHAIAQYHRLACIHAEKDDQPERVVELCERIRRLAPEFLPARELMVEGRLRLDQKDEAKRELDELGDVALRAGHHEQAESYFRRIQEIDPEDIGSTERLGKLLENEDRVDEAVKIYRQALELYEQSDEPSRAVALMEKIKLLRPEDFENRKHLVRMLQDRGLRGDAADQWVELIEFAIEKDETEVLGEAVRDAVEASQKDWPWRFRLAQLLTSREKLEMAGEQWMTLARDASEAREYEMAREAAGEGLRLQPESVEMRELRITANRRLSNYDAAADDLWELAEREASQSDSEKSMEYLRQAIELRPKAPELFELLADLQLDKGQKKEAADSLRHLVEIYRGQGNDETAIRHARRLVELDEGAQEPQEGLAKLLLETGRTEEAMEIWRSLAENLVKQGSLEAAIPRLARILEYLPGHVETLRSLADLSYESGGMLQAMAHYDRLIDAMESQRPVEEVEAEYRRILELEPGHLQLKERLADFQHQQGHHDEARGALQEILEAYRDERDQPTDALRVLRRIRTICPEQTEFDEQEAALLESLDRIEEAAQVWVKISQRHRDEGNLTEAAGCLAHRADLAPKQVEAQEEAASLFERLGDGEQATRFYLRAIEILEAENRHEDCAAILEKAIELNPERVDLFSSLGRAYERMDEPSRAVGAWLRLGALHEDQEQHDQARQTYAHVNELDAEDIESRLRLARLAEQVGDRHGAVEAWREVSQIHHERGEHEQQAQTLQKLLSNEPNDLAALHALSDVWRTLDRTDALGETLLNLERLHYARAEHEESLRLLGELKELCPDKPELLKRTIERMIETGNLEDAAEQGIELIQIYFDNGEDHLAQETLRRIAEIEPDNVERRISLARMIHVNGREEAARQEFVLSASKLYGDGLREECLRVCHAGVELFPDEVRLRDLLARVFDQLDRHEEAIEAQLFVAALHDEHGEEVKAQRVYEAILKDQPDHQATLEAMIQWAQRHGRSKLAVDHLMGLAESHYQNGRRDEAIQTLERIEEIDAALFEYKGRLAELILESGDESRAWDTWNEAARGFIDDDRFDAAIEVYQRLVQLRPDDAATQAALAEAYEEAGRTEDQLRESLRLAQLHFDQGRQDTALAIYEELTQTHPGEPKPWECLASLHESRDDCDEAAQAYHRLYEIHREARRLDQARANLAEALRLLPDEVALIEELGDLCLDLSRRPEGVEHLSRAAQLRMEQGERSRARELAERLLSLDPLNLSVRKLLGEALEATGDQEGAAAAYRKAARAYADSDEHEAALEILQRLLKIEPESLDEGELYAKLLKRTGRTEESVQQYLDMIHSLDKRAESRRAIRYCRRILSMSADHPEAHACLCDVYAETGKKQQAFQECEWLATHYLDQERVDQAEAYITKGLSWNLDNLGLRKRLIDVMLATGRQSDAARQLADLAQAAEQRSDNETAAWATAKACELDPDSLENHQRLADCQERAGQTDEARATRMKLMRLMLEGGRLEDARQLAERVVEGMPADDALHTEIAETFENAELPEIAVFHYFELARRALATHRHDVSEANARRVLDLKPRHVGARELLIEVLLADKRDEEAVEQFQRLEEIYREAGQWDGSLRTLQAVIELVPTDPAPRRSLIDLYRTLERKDAMIDQLRHLAEIYVNSDRCEEAIACLRELLEESSDDTRARMRYIDLYMQIGDEFELIEDYRLLAKIYASKDMVKEATETFEKLTSLDPQSAEGREEFIQFLFDQGDVERALEETRVLANVLQQQGKPADVIRVLERALNHAPDELDLRQRLAVVYLLNNRRGVALETFRSLARHYEQAGESEKLIDVLEQIVGIDHCNVEIRQQLAELYLQQGMEDKALAQYDKLAQQYAERELYDLAEHAYRRILERRPDDLERWERLIDAHLKIGEMRDIVGDLMVLANLYTGLGRLQDAVTVYRRILECEPENIEIMELYLDTYLQFGSQEDLVDDYLRLADLKLARGDLMEGIRVYKHMMEISPGNAEVQKRLKSTQAIARKKKQPDGKENGGTKSQTGSTASKKSRWLSKVISNYENILKLNPGNAPARAKLAELLEQAGRQAEADTHWPLVAEGLFDKGDLERCAEICECYITRHPEDGPMRDQLSRAQVQRDSLRLIDGALSAETDETA